MDEGKVETVRNWSREKQTLNGRLNNLFEVQQFFGLCNYYRWCILKSSVKPDLLPCLTRKDEPFVWEAESQFALEPMVTAFTTASVI